MTIGLWSRRELLFSELLGLDGFDRVRFDRRSLASRWKVLIKMANILVIMGGGTKNGNTSKLAESFSGGAMRAGHTVNVAFLGDKDIQGCRGCGACRYGKPCIVNDYMQEVYPLYNECDMVVLASPLYFWTISARTKAFLERLYATAQEDPNPPKGRYERFAEKDCALLMTSEDDLFWTFEQAVSYYRFNCLNYLGWNDRGMVLAGGCGGSTTKKCIEETKWLTRAFEFGRSL